MPDLRLPHRSQIMRLIWIDAVAANGDVPLRRGLICAAWGISVPQASLDLAAFQTRWPGRLTYDPRAKAYVAAEDSRPVFDAVTRHTILLASALAGEAARAMA